jgi:hypothetical protein
VNILVKTFTKVDATLIADVISAIALELRERPALR